MNSTPDLTRRTMLRGLGVGLALPLLDMRGADANRPPQRFIGIQTNQGILAKNFFPLEAGADYESTSYLDILSNFRQKMTVFSGVSHPEVDGGHSAERCFLTAAPHPGRTSFRNSISVDQYAAERIGHRTRFPSLAMGVGTKQSLSYTQSGVQIPGHHSPSTLFRKLFIQGSPEEVQAQVQKLRQGRSILDSVGERAKQLERQASAGDREKLDQFFTGVRELEQRLWKSQEWELKPKVSVEVTPPKDFRDQGALIERTRAMYDLAKLAMETDSTRLITIYIHQNAVKPNIAGVMEGTHPLTHHGNQPEKLHQLRLIEEAQFQELAHLLRLLDETKTSAGSLLDSTSVFYGTCMGNANAHSNNNLPTLLAGGGFRHGQHLALGGKHDYPLPNLFVSLLQRLGVESDHFATSTGTMRGLEMT
ncbi:MAG: DUF1552 domain-containing protein [Verrucomicrobiota bacterium]